MGIIRYFKEKFTHHKNLFGNILSLGTLQVFGYIFPLLVLPYVLPIIGVENFGKISFALSFAAVFMIIINYGFNLTATQDISLFRHDKKLYSQIYFGVIGIKLGLFFLCSIFFLGIIFSVGIFLSQIPLYLIVYLSLLGEVFFPIWMFQGMEKMKYITYINGSIKLASLGGIFFWVQHEGDYLLYPLILSIASVVSGLVGFIVAIKIFDIEWTLPSKKNVIKILGDGWYIFISGVFTSLYTSAIPFFLGLFTTPTVVGYYAGADKIIKAVQSLIAPVTQALFPTIAQKLKSGVGVTHEYLKKLTWYIVIFTGTLSLVLFFFANIIVQILLGEAFQNSVLLIQILSPLPVVIGLAIVCGHFVMVPLGYKKELSQIYVVFSLLSLAITLPLIYRFAEIGACVAVVCTEALITLCMYIFLKKNNIHIF